MGVSFKKTDSSLKHGERKFEDGQWYFLVDIGNKLYWKNSRTNQYQHIEVMEKIHGGSLPEGSIVHHKDEDGTNNDPRNLELCLSRHHHQMIHIQEDALAACGHADWRRCIYCGKYDDPKNMDVSKRADRGEHARKYRHKECYSESKKKWWANRTPEQVEREKKKKAEAYQARKSKLKKDPP